MGERSRLRMISFDHVPLGPGMCSLFSAVAMRKSPRPAAACSNARRTTSACAGTSSYRASFFFGSVVVGTVR